ncbi:MAG: bifunctional molybdenum cofactor biosynthesis protein MoaC/MoaB [Chitinophagaceae bacterium]|nr:bifunctional molybdenum cofactor biosynthesis protein MoaC/MoaB [Chitinophagaceae bacterium]
MVDIRPKNSTLRQATAQALLYCAEETIQRIRDRQIPKGDVLEFGRAAGLLAIKKTSDLIPDCHPLPIEFSAIHYDLQTDHIIITVEVGTIYKTGVEVEAMHGASLVALTLYDMLKPIDKEIEIRSIRLIEKHGGKSSYLKNVNSSLKIAVLVCSDSVFEKRKEDKAGKAIMQLLNDHHLETTYYEVIPDDTEIITQRLQQQLDQPIDLILFCGGTGLSPRDKTPEAVAPFIQTLVPGIMEAARSYGMQRTPYAMLSRGIAGMHGNTLIVTLPGSTKGAQESLQATIQAIKHLFDVQTGMRHD